MDLNVICQGGKRREHNKENEHAVSVSVLHLMLGALAISTHVVTPAVQRNFGSMHLENVRKVTEHQVPPALGLSHIRVGLEAQ